MLGCGFGRIGVDEATRAPFETGDLRQARNDLDMPVIVVVCWHVKGLRVQKVIVGRLAGGTLDTTDNVTRQARKFAKLASRYIFISRLMSPRGDPNLVAEAAGVGAEGDEVLGLAHDPLAGGKLALEHIKQKRAFLLLEEFAAGFELLFDPFGHAR